MTTEIATLVSHSAGPWSVHPYQGEGTVEAKDGRPSWNYRDVSIGSGEKIVAQVSAYFGNVNGGYPHVDDRDEQDANVRLIAAAPELLDDAKASDAAFTWLAEQMNSITDNAKHWSIAQIEALAQDLRVGIERNQKRTREAIAKAESR